MQCSIQAVYSCGVCLIQRHTSDTSVSFVVIHQILFESVAIYTSGSAAHSVGDSWLSIGFGHWVCIIRYSKACKVGKALSSQSSRASVSSSLSYIRCLCVFCCHAPEMDWICNLTHMVSSSLAILTCSCAPRSETVECRLVFAFSFAL